MKPLSYQKTIQKLKAAGFSFRRNTGGSHEVWWNDTTKTTCVVPHHKEIKSGTLKSILKQIGITEKEFTDL